MIRCMPWLSLVVVIAVIYGQVLPYYAELTRTLGSLLTGGAL